jgi:DNA-directed RNA polymerase specialized sigma24 family protein
VCSQWQEIGRALWRDVEAAGEREFVELGGRAPGLLAFDGPEGFLHHLHGRPGSDPERDRLLGEIVLASRANDGPGRLATALLWLAFWPALTALLERTIARASDDADELAADLAEKFTVVISKCDPAVVTRVAATLLWNTRRRFWDSLRSRDEVRANEVPLGEEAVRHLSVPPEADMVDVLHDLDRELGGDADLVLGCVVEGFTTREMAGRCGIAREAIKKRLQRASARLRACDDPNRFDRGVPDLGAHEPIRYRGMKQHEGSKSGINVGGKPRQRPIGRVGHRGGLRLRVRSCGSRMGVAAPAGRPPASGTAVDLPVLLLSLPDPAGPGAIGQLVSYCDVCRRWGERGSEHVCGQNWSEHLLPVLAAVRRRMP